ncbi:hypothetical protein CPB85DRAFT_996117 [Mucidula mucida]|nr:hypothetical protein CPB85DRAFT_996117 [Mucidula mucida]
MSVPLLDTNAISTFFLGLKAWYYRREVKAFISKYDGLAPTGLLYTMFWVSPDFSHLHLDIGLHSYQDPLSLK